MKAIPTKSKPGNRPTPASAAAGKRAALYARVSSEEQTKGNYPSCESQVEELMIACQSHGWEIRRVIKDEGFSAGSLKRPGLSELRWLIEAGEVNVVVCTWYDRLTRSRDFYVLDKEFQEHGVEFVTLHDPTDTKTAAGRFMESMLVAAKTYEREQTAEKVRDKMRRRAERGMWNGGPIPFGFQAVSKDRTIAPDPEQAKIVTEMFRIYVETQSDFKVRDWLKAHQIPTRGDAPIWTVSAIRRILTNRRYVAQIEINRENQGEHGLPEAEAYRVVPAPYEPVVALETFELAQTIRATKSGEHPNRVGRPRSYSQTQCSRVYPLQGIMVCGCCGHSMTPWYVCHKAGEDKNGKKRKKDAFIFYYICGKQRKGWKACDHRNCVPAHKPESWIFDTIHGLLESESALDAAIEKARHFAEQDLTPVQEAWTETQKTLQANQAQIDKLVSAITHGDVEGALWQILNDKAAQLKVERERLLIEQRQLKESLAPLDENFDADSLRSRLSDFVSLSHRARPEELQQLLRLTVRRIEWRAEGNCKVQLYHLPKQHCPPAENAGRQWLYTDMRNGSP
jgi:site-specific DNA recombinase